MVSNSAVRAGLDPGKGPGTELPPAVAAPLYDEVLRRLGIDRKHQPSILEVSEDGVVQFTRRLTPKERADLMVPLRPDGSNGIQRMIDEVAAREFGAGADLRPLGSELEAARKINEGE